MSDFLLVLGLAWLCATPYFAASGLLEFFARRRQRQIERIWGKRGR